MLKKRLIAAAMALSLAVPSAAGLANAEFVSNGDVNGDGSFTISDVVVLQRYLMGANVWLDRDCADVVKDNRIDVFDLCALREMIAKVVPDAPAPVMKNSVQINKNIHAQFVDAAGPDEDFIIGQTDFALSMLKQCAEEGENTFISPTSAVYALAMAANGADGETRKQMEQVIGGMPIEQLNKYLYAQRVSAPDRDKCFLRIANAIWNNENSDFHVREDFLRTNANYYDTEVYNAPFDGDTLIDINKWSNDHTDGMVPEILKELEPEAIMCLVNAVLFEAEWESKIDDLYDWTFHNADGHSVDREFMSGSANSYISSEHGIGICKYYSGRDYAFAAILPEEGMTPEQYIADLDAAEFNSILKNREDENSLLKVSFDMPTFELDYEVQLSEKLHEMGMTDAFHISTADFTRMFEEEGAFISKVLQKTHIGVDNNGTKAAAVTVSWMVGAGMPDEQMRFEHVTFNRPFVYMILDTNSNIPVFIGTLNSLDPQ